MDGDVACVLLDLHLADGQGLDVLRAVLAAGDVAVIVLTVSSTGPSVSTPWRGGAQDYLVKGEVDGALLIRAIRYAVERHQATRRLAEVQLARENNRRLERALLPRPLIDDPSVLWAMRYLPGGGQLQLGGDFLDAIQLEDGSIRAVIGDVCGRGPDEAAIGASLRIAWRTLVLSGTPEDEILPGLDRVLRVERPDPHLYVTVVDVTISPDRGSVRTRIAGHPAPIVVNGDVAILADKHRWVPIGVLAPDVRWSAAEQPLPRGAALLLYTDGLIEGRTAGRRLLGVEGLVAVAHETPVGNEPDEYLGRVMAEIQRHNGGPLEDDAACLLLAHGTA